MGLFDERLLSRTDKLTDEDAPQSEYESMTFYNT